MRSLGRVNQRAFLRKGKVNAPHAPSAEPEVAAEVAPPVVGTLEVQPATLNEPVDLELDTRVDEVEEVAACVFEGEGVGVDELLAYQEVDLRREIDQGPGPFWGTFWWGRLGRDGPGSFCGGGLASVEEGHHWMRRRLYLEVTGYTATMTEGWDEKLTENRR